MKKNIFGSVLITILLSSLVFLVGFKDKESNNIKEVYQVYLSGEKIGIIENDKDFYKLINKEQKELKEKYKVNNIYPPKGLNISPIITYKKNVNSVQEIYDYIKDKEPFTIQGYEVTIKRDNPIKFYILDKNILDKAITKTVEVFLDKEQYKKYLDGKQEKIKNEGSTIDNIYLSHQISIKESLVSTEDNLFLYADDLSKYFLYGTLETQKTYTVVAGDTLKDVAFKNQLNVQEFLIANPNIVNENALLYPGQVVNVGYINPLFNVVVESTLVQKQVLRYETIPEYDISLPDKYIYVKQNGIDGLAKSTYKVEYVNGKITNTVPLKTETIATPVDQIVVYGGYNLVYVGNTTYWSWPTKKTYIISSNFGWRNLGYGPEWHEGIDITGTGHKSHIYSIQNGKVHKSGYSSSMGYYVTINHNNGYYSIYMHLAEEPMVSRGDVVIKGQIIGLMGSTGRSTGTHLHLGIYLNRPPYEGGKAINPMELYR